MGTSWVTLSIKNIKTRASREMASRKNINIIFNLNRVNGCQALACGGARYIYNQEWFSLADIELDDFSFEKFIYNRYTSHKMPYCL